MIVSNDTLDFLLLRAGSRPRVAGLTISIAPIPDTEDTRSRRRPRLYDSSARRTGQVPFRAFDRRKAALNCCTIDATTGRVMLELDRMCLQPTEQVSSFLDRLLPGYHSWRRLILLDCHCVLKTYNSIGPLIQGLRTWMFICGNYVNQSLGLAT